MLLHESAGRRGHGGRDLVLLEDQDRTLWDKDLST